jgi:pyridoxine kinase
LLLPKMALTELKFFLLKIKQKTAKCCIIGKINKKTNSEAYLMINRPLRVAAIHDISSFGRCSLSVIIPVLSVMGVQVCPVPTAMLSTHTGGFNDFVFKDTTDFLSSCLAHWQKLNLDFECIYSGFLGSIEQISLTKKYFEAYPNALKVVDPVMGDEGKIYQTYTSQMCSSMNELVSMADIITPNLTEAALLLGEEYPKDTKAIDAAFFMDWLCRLSDNGKKSVVITGVRKNKSQITNYAFDRETGKYWGSACAYLPAQYPGTGDIYASVLIGVILMKKTLPQAMTRATDFVDECLKKTYQSKTSYREGVMLESVLPHLLCDSYSNKCYLL